MSWSILPNLLTVARILAVPPLVWLLLSERYGWALALAVAAGISDLADGWLARRFAWQSRFGLVADPLADKFLMTASYLTLAWLEHLPWWLVAVVVSRDLVIVFGGLVYHFRFERITINPTWMSKFNTFCQVFLMWVVLVRLAGTPVPFELQQGLIWLVAAMTLLTLVQYIWVWSSKAVRVSQARRSG